MANAGCPQSTHNRFLRRTFRLSRVKRVCWAVLSFECHEWPTFLLSTSAVSLRTYTNFGARVRRPFLGAPQLGRHRHFFRKTLPSRNIGSPRSRSPSLRVVRHPRSAASCSLPGSRAAGRSKDRPSTAFAQMWRRAGARNKFGGRSGHPTRDDCSTSREQTPRRDETPGSHAPDTIVAVYMAFQPPPPYQWLFTRVMIEFDRWP